MTPETGLIQHSDEVLGGTPVFAGTRVPVQTLFDYLEEGDGLESSLMIFPPSAESTRLKFLKGRLI